MKKNVAIVAGGYSSEFEVSLRSAENLYTYIDKERYNVYVVILTKRDWGVVLDGFDGFRQKSIIDKNDFSFRSGNETVGFDFAYITIHGTPGEDGLLQGYFEMLGIPYSSCGVLASALTFNKFACSQFLYSYDISVSDSILLRRDDPVDPKQIVEHLGLPVFVKPNAGGSSFGITKVKEASQIRDAVEKAFREGDVGVGFKRTQHEADVNVDTEQWGGESSRAEVIIERFVAGIELTCGCYRSNAGIISLPVTEVISENEFFDYGAKYNGEVQEITPARISSGLTKKIQQETEKIYALIGANGFIRIDYIVTSDEIPVVLDVNTTPGMTATSFIPQQVHAAGLNMKDIITEIIENNLGK